MMGYDAMALGTGELKLGFATIVTRMREARFPFISANAVVSNTGELIAPAFVLREVQGHRVAIVGLTGSWDTTSLPDTRVLDPVRAAQREIPRAARQSDVVILLSNAGNATDLQIADSVPGIDLIVGGGPFLSFGQATISPGSKVLIGHADYPARGHAGRIVGKAALGIDADGRVVQHTWQPITLGPDLADDPAMAAWRNKQQATGSPVG